LTILKTLIAQVDVLETITPLDFLSFRDRLESVSGFQSYQFREVEFSMGCKDSRWIDRYPEGSSGRQQLQLRLREPTVWDAFLRYLDGNGYRVEEDVTERDVTLPIQASPSTQRILLEIYQTDPTVSAVCERLVDLDEGLQEWRYRHVKMVERTIGARIGTGGSAGAEYLRTTLFRPAFPDLWAIRAEL
jgi:tryptophan 2,3-dioxygenase